MLALICPGQGSQQSGFLGPWLGVDGVAETLGSLSSAAGLDLAETGTRPDADVVDTAVAQPLLVAAGLATARLVGPLPSGVVVAGHSVGELTAAALAGVLDDESAMTLARERGRAMAAAAVAAPSGMTAMLGGQPGDVAAAIKAAGCWPANHNAAGQVVAAGDAAALSRLEAAAPSGARLRRLPVAGAFHTPLMQPAREALESVVAPVAVRDPHHLLVSNADGAVVADGRELVARLVRQVTEPVRWDLCMRALRELGVTATLELAPAGVLTALVRRELPDVEAVGLRTPDDLDRARDLVARHAVVGEAWTPAWRVVVAPANGTFHPAVDALGEVYPADPIGAVRQRAAKGQRGAEVQVPAPVPVRVVEWLAHDGDPVSEGQPVARIQPVAAS